MDFLVNFKVNGKIFLKDPESSAIGKEIVKKSIDLIYKLGFEQFTIKKLAIEIDTTEATIYRYFESKHRILLYILNWYWSYMEFLLVFKLQNVRSPKEKLKLVVELLTNELPASAGLYDYDKRSLNQVVIAESSKVYLIKEVAEINKDEVFKPYKDLCAQISEVIKEYNPNYKYPKSLSTTLIEASHQQQFFSINMPRLTDIRSKNNAEFTSQFIQDMLFRVLG
jgi:AcrR family transcriptional regulator